MESIFSYQFFQNALIASLLTAVVCGVVGSYIVVRRIVFISGGITHASFGGIGLGLYLGINPLLSAAGAAVLAAFSIGKMSETEGVREDSAIASVWALGMALGVLFMTLTPGYTTSLPSYLFGNILLVTREDLGVLTVLALGLILLFSLRYRTILYLAFDRDFAATRGVAVVWWERGLLLVIGASYPYSGDHAPLVSADPSPDNCGFFHGRLQEDHPRLNPALSAGKCRGATAQLLCTLCAIRGADYPIAFPLFSP